MTLGCPFGSPAKSAIASRRLKRPLVGVTHSEKRCNSLQSLSGFRRADNRRCCQTRTISLRNRSPTFPDSKGISASTCHRPRMISTACVPCRHVTRECQSCWRSPGCAQRECPALSAADSAVGVHAMDGEARGWQTVVGARVDVVMAKTRVARAQRRSYLCR